MGHVYDGMALKEASFYVLAFSASCVHDIAFIYKL